MDQPDGKMHALASFREREGGWEVVLCIGNSTDWRELLVATQANDANALRRLCRWQPVEVIKQLLGFAAAASNYHTCSPMCQLPHVTQEKLRKLLREEVLSLHLMYGDNVRICISPQ